TPHIRSGNLVAMDIKQTTEDVMSATGVTTPITSKREVVTSVVVADGETIILGGMIKETEKSMKRRVPGLSYIPLIGGLFQKVSKEKEKVDFVIFLTPQIIEDPSEMRGATMRAAGFTGSFNPADGDLNMKGVMKHYARSDLMSIDISPVEADIDARFRQMYQKSLKRR
ncbi:MAG: hypothetical protein II877_04565, partial [Synergistaceae bacterium]|nr:hypothetical protein [Synergistaceae bacterium]